MSVSSISVTLQRALLDGFPRSSNSPNEALWKPYGRYYSSMLDVIQKFNHELNGVFVRPVMFDENGVEIVNIPWSLTEIQGGFLNSNKLTEHLLGTMKDVKPPQANAFDQYIAAQRNAGISPEYFKACTMENCDLESKEIKLLFEDWPVGIMGDGCSVNTAANNKFTNIWGLLTPTARCRSHTADGSIKRMSKSQTMCVEEVK